MAIALKCKMCGGTLEFVPGDSVGVCEYCGTKQTLPKIDDEKKANLYDRANHFRRANDFDKAMGIYEQILDEDLTDAEAYWSLVLCRYGIEYVEDPTTHKRVPTVNRMQYTSIFADEDYKEALKHADSYQQAIYEAEAKEIDSIQKGILAISEKEEPFDVFICYKETDNSGRRTMDSVLAYDIYKELTEAGYKVFFSRVTLEDKLGTAYEPYIFAALNSAKVMVAVGTKTEYYNAVWVKNEWSRYLSLIRNGAKKTLIPVYRDMDPYDLPEEFSHLQGQDMGKIGFMQDLVRGIEKIIGSGSSASANNQDESIPEILQNASEYLEKGDWQNAKVYYSMVLDLNPKSVEAHLGNLLASQRAKNIDELSKVAAPFATSIEYKKVIQYGSQELKEKLASINESIVKRNKSIASKSVRIISAVVAAVIVVVTSVVSVNKYLVPLFKYNQAVSTLEEKNYQEAKEMFIELGDYKDSQEMITYCTLSEKYDSAEKLAQQGKIEDAIKAFQAIHNFNDAEERIASLQEMVYEAIYDQANVLMDNGKYLEAAEAFLSIVFFSDSREKIASCIVQDVEKNYGGKTSAKYDNYYQYLSEENVLSIIDYNYNKKQYENAIEWTKLFPEFEEMLLWWQKLTYQVLIDSMNETQDGDINTAVLGRMNRMGDVAEALFGKYQSDVSFDYAPAIEKLDEILGPYYERGLEATKNQKYDTARTEMYIPNLVEYKDAAVLYDEILSQIDEELMPFTGTWKNNAIMFIISSVNGTPTASYKKYDTFFKRWTGMYGTSSSYAVSIEYNADDHVLTAVSDNITYTMQVDDRKLILSGNGPLAGTYFK